MRFVLRASLGFIFFAVTVIGVVLAMVAMASRFSFERPNFSARNFERTWTVTTLKLENTSLVPTITAFGTVVAQDLSNVRSAVSGTLVSKSEGLRNGSFVQENQVLFTLDPFTFELNLAEAELALAESENQRKKLEIDLQNTQAQIASAQLTLTLAQETLLKQKKLFDNAVATQSEVDNARSQVSGAQANYDTRVLSVQTAETQLTAQDLVTAKARLAVERARKALTDTQIKAPLSGIISDLNFVSGAQASTQETLAVITDPKTYQIRFQISDAQYARFLAASSDLEGRTANVRWNVGNTLLTFEAVVEQILPNIDQTNGGIELLANVIDLEEKAWLPQGAFVSIHLEEPELVDVFVLPSEAISDAGGVFIIEGERLVEVMGIVLRRLESGVVASLPLKSGTEIVAKRYGQLSPGVKVEKIMQQKAPQDNFQSVDGAPAGQPETTDQAPKTKEADPKPVLLDLTAEQAAKAKKLLERFPIPKERKEQLMRTLNQNQIPEGLAKRIGPQIGL